MKFLILFYGEKEEKYFQMSSTESLPSMVSVNVRVRNCYLLNFNN